MYIRGATANFNSRPSARGDAGRECRCTASILYFNSRPSARGDQADDMRARLYAISIHAPPRGATLLHRSPSFLPGNFNSRPSARGDGAGKVIGECRIISIHAPPRGATAVDAVQYEHPQDYFNSRPSARGDGGADVSSVPRFLFQFTPLREGRRQQIRGAGDE